MLKRNSFVMQRIRLSTMAIYDVLYLSSITNTLQMEVSIADLRIIVDTFPHPPIMFSQVNNNAAAARVKSILHYEFSAPQKYPHCLLCLVVDLDCMEVYSTLL